MGMHLAGARLEAIAATVRKPDGSMLTQQGAKYCVDLCEEHGGVNWDGVLPSPQTSQG